MINTKTVFEKEGSDGEEQEVDEEKTVRLWPLDSQSSSVILPEMTHLKQLALASSLLFVVTLALSPPGSHDQPYSSINLYGKRPQPVYTHESSASSSDPIVTEELKTHSLQASKVIIRPVSTLTTVVPTTTHKQENEDGCSCESIDSCPIELMDFRFAVSCEYGTVRCCRPLEPVLVKEQVTTQAPTPTTTQTTTSITNKPVVITPASTLKWPKKSVACRCKPRKDCERPMQSNDEQHVDRKFVSSCPAGSVRCCESTNAGGSKTEVHTEAHVLGGNDFRPVQLPYLKMPPPADERISEADPKPADQELEPIENPSIQPVANVTVEEPQSTTEKEQEEVQPIPEQLNPITVPEIVNQPRPTPPFIQPTNTFFTAPIRPQNFQVAPPVRNPALNNFPVQHNPSFALGNQFQPPNGFPYQQMQFRPSPLIRQPSPVGSPQHASLNSFQPTFHNVAPPPPVVQPINGDKPFNLPAVSSFPAFNPQQQTLVPPPPQRSPAPPSPNPFQQQHFSRPTPAPSGGGFFSSLMNMFSSSSSNN